MSIVADLLDEYGAAIRGDWSQIDGRSVRADLELLADQIRNPTLSAMTLRERLDVCPRGLGHWTQYCSDYGCWEA